MGNRLLFPALASLAFMALYVYDSSQGAKNLTVHDIQGHWDLREVRCPDHEIQAAINSKIKHGEFQMRLAVEDDEIIESVLEKSENQPEFTGFRLKSTLELQQDSAHLYRESLEILRRQQRVTHEWQAADQSRQKTLKFQKEKDRLQISSEEICNGGTGIFLAVRAGSKTT